MRKAGRFVPKAPKMRMDVLHKVVCNTLMTMATSMTVKGQVTIPKRFRDLLGLKPGDQVDFVFDDKGQVVVRRAGGAPPSTLSPEIPDRFRRALGSADFKFGSTAECMKFLRGDDYEINGEP